MRCPACRLELTRVHTRVGEVWAHISGPHPAPAAIGCPYYDSYLTDAGEPVRPRRRARWRSARDPALDNQAA